MKRTAQAKEGDESDTESDNKRDSEEMCVRLLNSNTSVVLAQEEDEDNNQ